MGKGRGFTVILQWGFVGKRWLELGRTEWGLRTQHDRVSSSFHIRGFPSFLMEVPVGYVEWSIHLNPKP